MIPLGLDLGPLVPVKNHALLLYAHALHSPAGDRMIRGITSLPSFQAKSPGVASSQRFNEALPQSRGSS